MMPRSEAAAALLYPPFAAKIRAAAELLESKTPAIYILIVEGIRSGEDQNADFAKGRNAAGQIVSKRNVVTNAKAGQSMHQYGLAADIVPYLVGNTGELNWSVSTPQYQLMVKALKAQGLEWGGNWAGNLQDGDHFQMPGLPVSPTEEMRCYYTEMMASGGVNDPACTFPHTLDSFWASLSLSTATATG